MKKLLLSAALIGGFLFGAQAQESGLEPKAGYSLGMASTDFDGTKTSESSNGFHIGAVYTLLPNDGSIGLEAGALLESFSRKEDDIKISSMYLNVPVYAKFYATEAFSLVAGPNVGFLLSSKVDGEDASEGINSLNLGIGFGAGYELESGLSFSTRYNLGVSNLIEDAPDGFKATQSSFQISVGFKL